MDILSSLIDQQTNDEIAANEIPMPLVNILSPDSAIKVPKKKRAEIVNNVVDKFRYAETCMNDLRDTWEKIRDAYQAERSYTVPTGVKKPESRIKTRMLGNLVNRMVAMLTVRMVKPESNFIAARQRKSKNRLYPIENFVFDMFKRNQMAPEIVNVVTNVALYGVGFTKVIPNYANDEPDCMVEAVNQFDIFPEPNLTSLRNCAFIIHRLWMDHDTLVARGTGPNPIYYPDEVKAMIEARRVREGEGAGTLKSSNATMFGNRGDGGEFVDNNGNIKSSPVTSETIVTTDLRSISTSDTLKFDRYLIYEFYDGTNIYTVGEEGWLLRAAVNPLGYPFQAWKILPSSADEFWVKSHGEYLLDLQNEMDVKRNQRVKNINMINNPPMFYNPSIIRNPTDLVMDSGARIPIQDLEGFKVAEIDNGTDKLLDEMQYLRAEGEDVTSVSAVLQGQVSKKERMTSSESQSVYSNANLPFDFGSSLLVVTGLIPMLNLIIKMCAMIFKGKVATASASPNGVGNVVSILPEDFNSDIEVSVEINPSRAERDSQDASQWYQMFSQNPYINQIVLLNWIMPRLSPDYPRDLISQMPTGQMIPQNVQLSNNG